MRLLTLLASVAYGRRTKGVDDKQGDELVVVGAQASLRFLNERGQLFYDPAAEWLRTRCECGRSDCQGYVELRQREYEAIRSDGRCFVVLPGHGVDAVERPIVRCERFDVVRTTGIAAQVAADLAPRPPPAGA